MNDYQLIEFLLKSELVANELWVGKDSISVEYKTLPIGSTFFKEMEKTGRKFKVIANEIQFKLHQINQPKLKLAQ